MGTRGRSFGHTEALGEPACAVDVGLAQQEPSHHVEEELDVARLEPGPGGKDRIPRFALAGIECQSPGRGWGRADKDRRGQRGRHHDPEINQNDRA